MKVPAALILFTCAAFTACDYDPAPGLTATPGYPSDPATRPAPSSGDVSRYFREGQKRGAEDSKNRLRPNAAAHVGEVPPAYREEYTRGYGQGYKGLASQSAASQAQYFLQGKSLARDDHRRGLRYEPSRYFASLPAEHRDEFTRGYAAGW